MGASGSLLVEAGENLGRGSLFDQVEKPAGGRNPEKRSLPLLPSAQGVGEKLGGSRLAEEPLGLG